MSNITLTSIKIPLKCWYNNCTTIILLLENYAFRYSRYFLDCF